MQTFTEQISNTTIKMRPLADGTYLVTANGGGLKTRKLKTVFEDAINEFLFTCSKVTTFTYGEEHYE